MADFTRCGIPEKYIGASTDIKPTGIAPGSECYETDTGNTYITADGTNWTLMPLGAIEKPLANNETYTLPAGPAAAIVRWGDLGAGVIHWTAAGVPDILIDDVAGGIFVTTDTDTKVCAYQSGASVILKNRSGSAVTVKVIFI